MASLGSDVRIRLAEPADAAALLDLVLRNREFWRTGEPRRPDDYYTAEVQRARIEAANGASSPEFARVFLVEVDGRLVGHVGLHGIIRGPFQSADVAYAVDEAVRARGVATAALRQLIVVAFDQLNLHRLQGGTLIDNEASKRVLANCGFVHYGRAPEYLKIDGRWQTNDLFQLINLEHRTE